MFLIVGCDCNRVCFEVELCIQLNIVGDGQRPFKQEFVVAPAGKHIIVVGHGLYCHFAAINGRTALFYLAAIA